jgi:hypothetical protein
VINTDVTNPGLMQAWTFTVFTNNLSGGYRVEQLFFHPVDEDLSPGTPVLTESWI